MQRLDDWDFHDASNNEKVSLINRQKSALMLSLVWIDYEQKIAEFLNHRPKQGKDSSNTASLYECDCVDFKFVGRGLRKSLQPCMHIYRLAFELEVLVPTHFSASRYVPLSEEEKEENKRVKKAAIQKLQNIPKDPDEWGAWNRLLHREADQQRRIQRAISIKDDEPHTIVGSGKHWSIHDYGVDFLFCECADFQYRSLPCKHMYTAALASGINLEIVD